MQLAFSKVNCGLESSVIGNNSNIYFRILRLIHFFGQLQTSTFGLLSNVKKMLPCTPMLLDDQESMIAPSQLLLHVLWLEAGPPLSQVDLTLPITMLGIVHAA